MAYTTIPKSSSYFNTKLWTGNSTNSTAITGVGFQPDMTWIKNRSQTDNHNLFDAIRGATYRIYPDDSSAQDQATNSLASFDSDGFTLNDGGPVNGNGENIVGWNWKANGSGSANGDGDINSTVSANTTSGFSIVKYTGTGSNATVGHGLGAVPKMIIVKSITGTQWWFTYHIGMGNTKHITLNTTNAASGASSVYWNNTTPTSSVFSIGTDTGVNQSGIYYVAYCFADIQGFSKAGSYVGNGEPGNDAPFIYTGFKPAFVLLKSSTYAESWSITDNRRLGYNGSSAFIKADASQAEATDLPNPDFLSNGFKLQTNDNVYNKNTQTYIYMAFAEAPLVGSNNIPATAR